jgi:hypothetical protein
LCALPIPCRQDYLSIKNGWGPSGAENKNQTATERLKQKVAFSRLRGIGKKENTVLRSYRRSAVYFYYLDLTGYFCNNDKPIIKYS